MSGGLAISMSNVLLGGQRKSKQKRDRGGRLTTSNWRNVVVVIFYWFLTGDFFPAPQGSRFVSAPSSESA